MDSGKALRISKNCGDIMGAKAMLGTRKGTGKCQLMRDNVTAMGYATH